MRLRNAVVAVVLLPLAGAAATVRAEVAIKTVTVGNPGNFHDEQSGAYGGVDYVYNISRYEVTAGQYCEFLNAVAAADQNGLYTVDMGNGEKNRRFSLCRYLLAV
ncbi:MAG: hypothetical protein ACYTFA_08295 [Planctomycetota bacterium]